MRQRELKRRRINTQRLRLHAAAQAGLTQAIEARLAQLEAEVARGERDARSLVAIPAAFARDARVTFPASPLGEPIDWRDPDEALLRKVHDRLSRKSDAMDVDLDDL